jgi:hypothetical protein
MALDDSGPDQAVSVAYFEDVIDVLKGRGVSLEKGLSSAEMASLEDLCGFSWPPDLRVFLQLALPTGSGFPNWRGSYEAIRELLALPVEGICFDIEWNDFWFSAWGTRPKDMKAALATARSFVEDVPRLVPVYFHRFLPSEPLESGNPVLSVHQTDIIIYGNDLPGYFHQEFRVPLPSWARSVSRSIRFWDQIVLLNSERE